MRTYIYAETTFQIYKNKGGRFIPQHKSPFSSKFECFTESGVTVNRARRSDAEKYIQRKAKVANPHISFLDGSEQQKSAPQPSEEVAAIAALYTIKLQVLNERLNGSDLTKGTLGEQMVLQQKQHLLTWFSTHNIQVQA